MYRGKHRDKQNGNIYMWIKENNTRAISTNNFDLFIIGFFKCFGYYHFKWANDSE